MTYFKYVERDVKDQINWAEVGKGVTDMLKAETVARETKKAEIAERSRKFGEQLSNSPTGDYDAGNTFMRDYSTGMQEYRLLQDRLLQTGQLSLGDYTRNRQNNTSGTTQMFDLAKEYQAEYSEKMKRWDGNESSFREVWEMEQAEGLANLRNVGAYINPTNGVVSIGKRDDSGAISGNPNEFATVPELRSRLKQKYNRFDLDGEATASANSLGEIENSEVFRASEGNLNTIVTEVNAMKGNYTDEQKEFVATYNDWENAEADKFMDNPNNISSILTDRGKKAPNGKAYTFTYDKDAFDNQGAGGNLIYLNRDAKSGVISGAPVFTPEQEKDVKSTIKMAIRARIDQKRTTKSAGNTPFDPPANVARGDKIETAANVVTNFNILRTGNKEQKLQAANSLRGYNDNINTIELSEDGNGIRITYKSGRNPETIPFGEDPRAFIEAGVNFVLPQKDRVADINEVFKASNIKFENGQYVFGNTLEGTDYAFSSAGEQTTVLPFDEAFTNYESSKINVNEVFNAAGYDQQDFDGDNMTTDQEDAAVTKLQTMVRSIPQGDKIKITEFGTGRGINIQIPSATRDGQFDKYAINLKEGSAAKEELQEVVKLIINYSLGKQRLLLDPEAQEKYSANYGTYTGTGENKTLRAPTD